MSPNELLTSFASSQTHQQTRSQAGIAIGFGILLLLIFLTAWISLSQMNQNQLELQHVLEEHVTKLELINQMRYAARERTIALQKLILLEDPFEQDDTYLAFNRFGAQFARARLSYIALGLTSEEKSILELQGKYTSVNVPVQLAITDMIMEGKKDEAHRLLIEKAIPAQDLVFEQLSKLHAMQKADSEQAAVSQASDYDRARSLILLFATAIATLGILVAGFIILRTRRFQKALYDTREKAIVTLQSIGEAVISTNRNGLVEYINPQAEALLGMTLSAAHRKPLSHVMDLREEETPFDASDIIKATIQSSKRYYGPQGLELHSPDSLHKHLIELTAAPISDQHGNITGTVIAIRDVTTLHSLNEELSFQATHDSLTGLLNRREFEQRVLNALEQARVDRDEHAVCYIDLDMFKTVNDTCGHIAGDELLRQLAMLLQDSIRKTDALARVGGDEFALLLQSCDMNKANILANNLLETIAGFRFQWENKTFNIGASIGLAPIHPNSGTLMGVMQIADFACYSAKDAGRNRVYIADSDNDLVGKRRGDAQWISRLNEALKNNQFELYYQDITSLHTDNNATRHVELLLRLISDDGEIISPRSFIPAAERYHLMPDIDQWVIKEATSLLANAKLQGNTIPWQLSINISGQSLSDRRFLDFVLDQLEASNIQPECICFEVTETCAISNLSSAIRVMNTLKGVGCRLALDDFGSGLSSFAYLKSLPIDSVKIDGLFVRDLDKDMTHQAIVSSIANIARIMDIRTVAEFVENVETFNILKEIGVDYAQGYYLGRPAPFQNEILKKNIRAV